MTQNPHHRRNTDLVAPLTQRGFTPVGRLRTRTAREIGSSPWSIGCETIDRGYVDFAPIRPHLAELGATAARVQAGWARCEPVPGQPYNWAWLDEVVDGCLAEGVRPWLQTSYGNPGYEGGGGIGLAQGIPTSPQALAAWDRWVAALAHRYADRIRDWEVWNEPDNQKSVCPEDYGHFFIRTARILRSVRADARMLALAIAGGSLDYIETFLRILAEHDALGLLDQVTFHFYPHNPDGDFDRVAAIESLVQRYAPHVTLRQGETGAPSETRQFMAMGKFEWSERKQAAWNLRRLLAHHARGYPMSLFQMADMHYEQRDGAKFTGRNAKGQLCINPDKTVAYRKPSYFAASHVFSLLDDRFELRRLASAGDDAVAAYAWTALDAAGPGVIAWWRCNEPPSLATPALGEAAVRLPRVADAVLLDFMSGMVFAPPSEAATSPLPCIDTPLAWVSRDLIDMKPAEDMA